MKTLVSISLCLALAACGGGSGSTTALTSATQVTFTDTSALAPASTDSSMARDPSRLAVVDLSSSAQAIAGQLVSIIAANDSTIIGTIPDPVYALSRPIGTTIVAFKGGAMKSIGSLGGWYGTPQAINSRGQVIGYSCLPGCTQVDLFFYSEATGMVDIGTLGDGTYFSRAWALSENGNAAGISYTTTDLDRRAFLYRDGVLTDLGRIDPNVEEPGTVEGVNDAGQVVGSSTAFGPRRRAALYSNGTVENLGVLDGAPWSIAYGINNLGQIVGESTRPFLYTGGKMIDLGTFGGVLVLQRRSMMLDKLSDIALLQRERCMLSCIKTGK